MTMQAESMDGMMESWIRARLTGRLDGCIHPSSLCIHEDWSHHTPSHRLPAPGLIVFTAEQPYQMLENPSWRVGSAADHVICRQQPLPFSSVSQQSLILLHPSTIQLC